MSPVVNINSISDCERAYKYHQRYGNYLTDDLLNAIEEKWESFVKIWDKEGSADVVDYSSGDLSYNYNSGEYSEDQEQGWNTGESVAGNVNKAGMTGRAIVDAGVSAGNAVNSVMGYSFGTHSSSSPSSISTQAPENIDVPEVTYGKNGPIEQSDVNAGETWGNGEQIETDLNTDSSPDIDTENAAESSSSNTSADEEIGSWIVSAPLAFAQWISYIASKPQEAEKEACAKLCDEMLEAQSELSHNQSGMEKTKKEIEKEKEEAQKVNVNASKKIENEKTKLDTYNKTYKELNEILTSNGTLTDSQQALYNDILKKMEVNKEDICKTSQDATDSVGESHEKIASQQGSLDDTAKSVNKVIGLTDFAENIDERTQAMCYVEAASQGLNSLTGGKAAINAGKFALSGGWATAWAWAFAAMGATAAAGSGVATVEQFQWASDIGAEIDTRVNTQDHTGVTEDDLADTSREYNKALEHIENLALEIPDNLEIPDDLMLANNPEENPENNNKKNRTV